MRHDHSDHLQGDKVVEVGNGQCSDHTRDCIFGHLPYRKYSKVGGLGVKNATIYASTSLA